MEHTNEIAIQILRSEHSDYPHNAWHYDSEYKMIVEGIDWSVKQKDERIKELEAEKEHHSLDNFTHAEIVQHLEDYY
jgi:hypothetical protein